MDCFGKDLRRYCWRYRRCCARKPRKDASSFRCHALRFIFNPIGMGITFFFTGNNFDGQGDLVR